MDIVLIGFLGVAFGALIGWHAALSAADRTARRRARELRDEERATRDGELRRAHGEELRRTSLY
jgi:gas vesicle protein